MKFSVNDITKHRIYGYYHFIIGIEEQYYINTSSETRDTSISIERYDDLEILVTDIFT